MAMPGAELSRELSKLPGAKKISTHGNHEVWRHGAHVFRLTMGGSMNPTTVKRYKSWIKKVIDEEQARAAAKFKQEKTLKTATSSKVIDFDKLFDPKPPVAAWEATPPPPPPPEPEPEWRPVVNEPEPVAPVTLDVPAMPPLIDSDEPDTPEDDGLPYRRVPTQFRVDAALRVLRANPAKVWLMPHFIEAMPAAAIGPRSATAVRAISQLLRTHPEVEVYRESGNIYVKLVHTLQSPTPTAQPVAPVMVTKTIDVPDPVVNAVKLALESNDSNRAWRAIGVIETWLRAIGKLNDDETKTA